MAELNQPGAPKGATIGNSSMTTPDMPVTVKLVVSGSDVQRKMKFLLKDMGPQALPRKFREVLGVADDKDLILERYSDSAAKFVVLDSQNAAIYKQLNRAARAKGKLRIRATVQDRSQIQPSTSETTLIPGAITAPSPQDNNVSLHGAIPIRMQEPEAQKSASAPPKPTCEDEPDANIKEEPKEEKFFWPLKNDSTFSEETKQKFAKRCPQGRTNAVPAPCRYPPAFVSGGEKEAEVDPLMNFTVQCNNCDDHIPNVHWHCSICDDGDYDLCAECVKGGVMCEDSSHWMIKRSIRRGKLVNSETETFSKTASSSSQEEEAKAPLLTPNQRTGPESIPVRTCNSCVQVFPEYKFVTCTDCDDYDLCTPCHIAMKHGHHPGHTFAPAVKGTALEHIAGRLLGSGRGIRHAAVCDGCEKRIIGTRYKCLNCPDWDYCSKCSLTANVTHPYHRFTALHEPIAAEPRSTELHYGICCDGPLCKGKNTYIIGDRYKCAVCDDTDFCANCEALPRLEHNPTHPLLKFKRAVQKVSVSTFNETNNGETTAVMGDVSKTSSKSTETQPRMPPRNAATQVQTIAEVEPAAARSPVVIPVNSVPAANSAPSVSLQAHFVRDSVPDGTTMPVNTQFTQTWTIKNPGPVIWPSGCSVCFVGGDSMLDVDPDHPSSLDQLQKALTTNSIDHEVESGEEVDFSVSMRTPHREGKMISYWRLKTPQGLPFGHRLWCDLIIRSPASQQTANADSAKSNNGGNAAVKEQQPEASQMIFPTLEKESPVSSSHEAQSQPAVAKTATTNPHDQVEDIASLELEDDDESSEEGFMTDEEYDLLASGDEMETAKNGAR